MLADQNVRLVMRSDQELAALVKEGHKDAFSALCGRFTAAIKSRAWRYSGIAGVDVEDFVQEGLLALYRASYNYDALGRAGFRTYATTCINHSMSAAVKSHFKHLKRRSPFSLDCLDTVATTSNSMATDKMPEQLFFDMENARLRAEQIKTRLSRFEQQVLRHYLMGQSYGQISKLLSTSAKSVDNALQRVRRKLRLPI